MSGPRIFYYCHDSNQPAGGEKHSYQHVDILHRHGFETYALHRTRGFRLTWFENDTPVAYWPDIVPDPTRDYIVVPETFGLRMRDIPGRKVVFNKNVYHGFDVVGLSDHGPGLYLSDETVAIISVSHHNAEHLRYAYPSKPLVVVRPDIRPSRFAFRPLATKKLQIAYAAKGSADGRTLYQMLRGRAAQGLNRFQSVRWVPIAGLTEDQVAETLQDTLLLIFLSVHEGLARLPLEAMACGCVVCAYDCGAQVEYLPPSYRFARGDLLSMARHVERVVASVPHDVDELERVTREARMVAEQYSAAAQERSVLDAWRFILRETSAPRPARQMV